MKDIRLVIEVRDLHKSFVNVEVFNGIGFPE